MVVNGERDLTDKISVRLVPDITDPLLTPKGHFTIYLKHFEVSASKARLAQW